MFRLNKTLASLFLFWLLACASIFAGPKDPITGESFQKYVELQNVELQDTLRAIFAEEDGFIVMGPLDPNKQHLPKQIFESVRVICPNLQLLKDVQEIIARVDHSFLGGEIEIGIGNPPFHDNRSLAERLEEREIGFGNLPLDKHDRSPSVRFYDGRIIVLQINNNRYNVLFQTINQFRWLFWAKRTLIKNEDESWRDKLRDYANAVSGYLFKIDKGNLDAAEPKAVDFGLEESFDLYAPAPDYVIAGYQNYKDYLKSHAEIVTSNLSEILAFVPTESGLERLKSEAPDIAYPNKEFPLLQEEFRKFIRRGGQMSYMRTLTKEVFDTLKSAEYFFAVGMSGKIRFGRELLREEVKRIEAETGQKPARANHAFLFVGEPILTAGAFFIENNGEPKIVEVNTQSGHYFYSNITATIREDVAERSNDYFKTIGHFFRALDSLEIDYYDVLLRKL